MPQRHFKRPATGRAAIAWSTEGYDGQTHYTNVLKALAPAFFILSAVAALMVTIL